MASWYGLLILSNNRPVDGLEKLPKMNLLLPS